MDFLPIPTTHRSSGCVRWPVDREETGEGGTWVLAIVADDHTLIEDEYQDREQRPFERCHVDTLPQLLHPNVLVDPDPTTGDPYIRCPRCNAESPWNFESGAPHDECPACGTKLSASEAERAHYQRFPLEEHLWPSMHWEADAPSSFYSREFLACVCLGSTTGCWLAEDGESRYVVTKDDLTEDGAVLVDMLERLYSRDVELLTLIDT